MWIAIQPAMADPFAWSLRRYILAMIDINEWTVDPILTPAKRRHEGRITRLPLGASLSGMTWSQMVDGIREEESYERKFKETQFKKETIN